MVVPLLATQAALKRFEGDFSCGYPEESTAGSMRFS
jgi:hypothetical protein